MPVTIKTAPPKKGEVKRTNRINKVNPKAGKNSDPAKENWKDKEVQAQAKEKKLHELFPGFFIDKQHVEMIEWMINNYKECAIGKKVVVTQYIPAAEIRTASNIIIDSDDFQGEYSARHGKEIPKAQYPSHVAIILSVGTQVDLGIHFGDIVRFSPMSAAEIKFGSYHVWVVYELDVQVKVGTWLK